MLGLPLEFPITVEVDDENDMVPLSAVAKSVGWHLCNAGGGRHRVPSPWLQRDWPLASRSAICGRNRRCICGNPNYDSFESEAQKSIMNPADLPADVAQKIESFSESGMLFWRLTWRVGSDREK